MWYILEESVASIPSTISRSIILQVEEDGQLLEQEERERGKTSRWNYVVYLRACGLAFGLGYLFCAIAGQGQLMSGCD